MNPKPGLRAAYDLDLFSWLFINLALTGIKSFLGMQLNGTVGTHLAFLSWFTFNPNHNDTVGTRCTFHLAHLQPESVRRHFEREARLPSSHKSSPSLHPACAEARLPSSHKISPSCPKAGPSAGVRVSKVCKLRCILCNLGVRASA